LVTAAGQPAASKTHRYIAWHIGLRGAIRAKKALLSLVTVKEQVGLLDTAIVPNDN